MYCNKEQTRPVFVEMSSTKIFTFITFYFTCPSKSNKFEWDKNKNMRNNNEYAAVVS